MRNKLRFNSLLIALLVSLLVSLFYGYGFLERFENNSLDFRFRIRGPQTVKSPIVIAAIDDQSLTRIGKWPWRREVQAKLVDVFTKGGASAVVFDVLFYEPDKDRPQDDIHFSQSIKKNGRTVLAYSFDYAEESYSAVENGKTALVNQAIVTKSSPLGILLNAAKGVGFVNCFPDKDGYLRRAPLVYRYEGEDFYPLNLLSLSVAKEKPAAEILRELPLYDSESWGYPSKEALINFRGPVEGTFNIYSCADLLDGIIPPDWLKDKIVLIGSTALGLYDHYPTPFSSSFPGLYFHANVIDNLWARDFLTPIAGVVTLILIFVFGLMSGIFVPRVSAVWGALLTLSGAALFSYAAYFLMASRLLVLEWVAPMVSLGSNYILIFFYRFIVEQKEKAGIKRAFGVYVNPHIVEQIAKNPEGLKLGGELREMSVMFSDVAGFTSISEKLSPQELVHLLNLYLTKMTDTIMKYDGTVDKYEGDAIMAFWGAPLVQEDHAKKACFSVLENREKLKELNGELEKKAMTKLFVRCGINSGPMNVGNMGSEQKFNYTVMGDAVNLASRLEGANKEYGTPLMISEMTYEKVKEVVEARELDLLRVKGKQIPIRVYELLNLKGKLSDAELQGREAFEAGLTFYRARNFKEALAKFNTVINYMPGDGPAETYRRRSQNYLQTPPPENWDGVYVMTTK